MKLLLLQFGAVMANTTIEVDAERLLSEDADRSLASTSVCTNKSRIFERGQDMTDYHTELSDFSLKSGHSRWDTCNMFKCRIECHAKNNKVYLRVLEWEWDSTSETTTTRTTTKAAASKICDNKTEIVNLPPQLKISLGKRFRLAATKGKSTKRFACKHGERKFLCTLKCLSRNGAVQLDYMDKEKVCMFKDLKFEEGNDEDMFQLEHLKQSGVFLPGKKVSVKCNKYSLGTSTELQCRNGKVVYNEDCLWARLNKNGCPLASNVADADKVDLTKNCTSEDNFRWSADLKCKNGKTITYYRMLLSEKFKTYDRCDSNDA